MNNGVMLSRILPFDEKIIAGVTKKSTEQMYRRDLLAYLEFAKEKEIALKPSTLARWRTYLVAEEKFSPNTINRMLSAVRSLMKEAAVQEYIGHDVAEAFKHVNGVKIEAMEEKLKPHAQTRISQVQMRQLTNAPDISTLVGLRDAALLHTLASSGIRASEAARLTCDRIGFEKKEENIFYYAEVKGKNDTKYRRVLLTREAYGAIKLWLSKRNSESIYVFTGFRNHTLQSTDKAISAVSVWRTVQKYAEKCGLSWIKPHDFRRFVATQLTKEYGLRKAQQALGHKNIATTEKYDLSELELGMTEGLY